MSAEDLQKHVVESAILCLSETIQTEEIIRIPTCLKKYKYIVKQLKISQ